ncbi:MAG: hypothetical protein AB7V43_15615 [Acidimicrobiia bacterium]
MTGRTRLAVAAMAIAGVACGEWANAARSSARPPVRLVLIGQFHLPASDEIPVGRLTDELFALAGPVQRATVAIVTSSDDGSDSTAVGDLRAFGFDAVVEPGDRAIHIDTGPDTPVVVHRVVHGASAPGVEAAGMIDTGADVVWTEHPDVPAGTATIASVHGRAREGVTVDTYGVLDLTPGSAPSATQMVEVIGWKGRVVAGRVTELVTSAGYVRSAGPSRPMADAVNLAGQWWSLMTRPVVVERRVREDAALALARSVLHDEVAVADVGRATDLGGQEIVAAYWTAARDTSVVRSFPTRRWVDGRGRTPHVGVFELDGTQVWRAGTVPRPIIAVTVCRASMAVRYGELDRNPGLLPSVGFTPSDVWPIARGVATAAWTWGGYGYVVSPELPGDGVIGCSDVDGDGRLDPIVRDRATR